MIGFVKGSVVNGEFFVVNWLEMKLENLVEERCWLVKLEGLYWLNL